MGIYDINFPSEEESDSEMKRFHEDSDSSDSDEVDSDICDEIVFDSESESESEFTLPNLHGSREHLNLPSTSSGTSSSTTKSSNKNKSDKFPYGNYSRYYSYRNSNEDFSDIRLELLRRKCPDLLKSKECLDIGCNNGMITIEIAKKFNIKNIIGLDIDKELICRVKNFIEKMYEQYRYSDDTKFPYNIDFLHANYILKDSVLLEIETEQFDVIICLSVTKWIHLNYGDQGLKQAFKRMYLQLRPGGKLILEAQPWTNYKRRKNLTPQINANYKNIKFFPKNFTDYLLSSEIGFERVNDLGKPNHSIKGFQRPIQVFYKSVNTVEELNTALEQAPKMQPGLDEVRFKN